MELINLPEDPEKRFIKLEKIIEKGMAHFVEVGWALTVIRDEKLYTDCHGTFDEYCKARWGFARSYAYRLMDSAKTVRMIERMSPNGDKIPTSEGQIRPLSSLPEEERPEVWDQAVERSEGHVTAATLEEVIAEREEPTLPPPLAPIVVESRNLKDLKRLWFVATELDKDAFLDWIGGSYGKSN